MNLKRARWFSLSSPGPLDTSGGEGWGGGGLFAPRFSQRLAVLLRASQADEAEKIYREDLLRYPGNGWSLSSTYASRCGVRAKLRQRRWRTRD